MEETQLTGRNFGQYRIDKRLGQGGMGMVFQAWDTRLSRWVAIKILSNAEPQVFGQRKQLLSEARAAAALNHPNIVTIYEVGRQAVEPGAEIDFIAMEFVPGRTLHELIQAGRLLPLDEVLHYAIQIADAVVAAHTAGITHRDLKPANIIVTEKRRVKVLDFGIAQRLEPADEADKTRTADLDASFAGGALGTLRYMSPEQVQNKTVDTRSDIFALGAILFEMLTGRRAFTGDSVAAVISAILVGEPPPISLVRPVPEELERVVRRCLRKDVERRLQHAGDLKVELEEIRTNAPASMAPLALAATTSPGGTTSTDTQPSGGWTLPTGPVALPAPPAAPAPRRRWPLAVAAVAAAAGLSGAGAWAVRRYWPVEAPNPLATAKLTRITRDEGLSAWPALSRDGKFIAYASDRPDGKSLHIWVQQVAGGKPIQLTNGDADDTEPEFSPDGARIAFRSERDGGGVYVVPALGGQPRLIASQGRRPRFSPDGARIAYWIGENLGKTIIANAADGSNPEQFQPGFASAKLPVWSPDGKQILFEGMRTIDGLVRSASANPAFARGVQRDEVWWIAPVAGGAAQPTGLYWHVRQRIFPDPPHAWLTGDRILFSGITDGSLWSVKLPAGRAAGPKAAPERLTFGTGTDRAPAAAGGGEQFKQIAFAGLNARSDLWMLPIDANRGKVAGPMQRLTEGVGTQYNQLSMSANGNRIAYLSDRDGQTHPFIRDLAGGWETAVSGQGVMWQPYLSPDGGSLAWSIFVNGRPSTTYRASIGEQGQLGLVQPVCTNCGTVTGWSPDGRQVVFGKIEPTRTALLDLSSGESHDLLVKKGADVFGGRFSPDGKWLTMNAVGPPTRSRVWIAPFDRMRRGPVPESEWIAVTPGDGWDDKPRWAPDSKSVYFVSERDGFRCVWRQTLDEQTRRPVGEASAVAHFHQARLSMRNVPIGSLSIQVGPSRLVVMLGELTGNVWVLTPGEAPAQ